MSETYTSNRLEMLCSKLAENILKPKSQLFAKETIITQTAGMNAWLKTELARRNRVFANFEFQNQDGFIAEMHLLLCKSRLQNNSDTVKYRIYDLLGSSGFQAGFSEVAAYYEQNDLRKIQLSAKIADLFDQYQLYRPEIIQNWENGQLSTANSAEEWQQWLWQAMNMKSRAKTKTKIIDEFENQQELIQKTYPEISLFGISVFTEFHLDFFRELSKYTQVNFYLCHPTDKTDYKNELLLAFGSKARELAEMFPVKDFRGEENQQATLLAGIQNQILKNQPDLQFVADDSIQINSCFTPVREAECLYNYLLDLFDKDRSLKPQDVLVMATDINKYSPFIKAVFRNAPVIIPFQVSGLANNSDDSMVSAMELILNFCEEDLTSEKVISLLEQKRIKQRFGISDCNYLRSMVRKANIRFGRENRVEDDTRYVSWKYGLEKILLGYSMLTDKEYPIDDDLTVFPFKDMEGSGTYDLFKLKAFVETLLTVIDVQKESKTLSEWKLFLLENVIEKMISHDDFEKKDREEFASIYRALSFIDNLTLNDKMPFAVILEELKTRLFSESRETKLNTGRVTVSNPIPVRGIPYKVICFLGLNNDAFPGKDSFMGFDLLGEEYRMGDRSKKETDKYLFLDTILAAREKLYLSYIGRSVKNNAEIPPSIVIDTLTNYLGEDFQLVAHPMHGFSSQYQKTNKRLFTYLYNDQKVDFDSILPAKKEFPELTVHNFTNFFENPINWYFKTILNIKLEGDDDILPETELFALTHLEKWFVKNELLTLSEADVESYFKKGIKEGQLPLKNTGRVSLDEINEEIEAVKKEYLSLTANKTAQSFSIDITLENIRLTGTIGSVYKEEYIAFSFSSNKKHWIVANLQALLLSAMGKIKTAIFLEKDGSKISIPVIEPEHAMSRLKLLMQFLQKGTQSPLKYTLKAGEAALKPTANVEKVYKAFMEEANGNYHSGVPSNPYVKILLEEGYFEGLDQDALNEMITISRLLNL